MSQYLFSEGFVSLDEDDYGLAVIFWNIFRFASLSKADIFRIVAIWLVGVSVIVICLTSFLFG